MKKLIALTLALTMLFSMTAMAGKTYSEYGYREFRSGLKPVLTYDEADPSVTEWNYINEEGTIVDLNKGRFVYVFDFFEGLAAVINHDFKLGYIDTKGNIVIPCQYGSYEAMGVVYAGYFHNGQANVLKENYSMIQTMSPMGYPTYEHGTWQVATIDKTGKLISGFKDVEGMSSDIKLSTDMGLVGLGGEDEEEEPTNTPSTWAEKEITEALAAGIVPSLTGNPIYQDTMTREQFAELIVQMVKVAVGDIDTTGTPAFKDTDNPSILEAAAAGIVTGTSTDPNNLTASPKNATNREQIASMIYRAILYIEKQTGKTIVNKNTDISTFSDSASVSAWAKEGVGILANNDIMNGSGGLLSPAGQCTIEQSILLVYRTFLLCK